MMKPIIEKNIYFFGNIETLLLAAVAFAIPFQINFGNITIIVSVLYASLLLLYRKTSFSNFKSFYFLIPVILFFIAFVSAITSKDIGEGMHQLEKLLLMVLIPLIISTFHARNINFFKVFCLFSSGITLATLILLAINLSKLISGAPYEELFFFEFTKIYDQHPVYYSTNIVLSIFFVVDNFIVNNSKYKNLKIVYPVTLIHLLGLMFCASKAVIICFFALLILYIIIIKKEVSKKILLLTFSVISIGILSIIFNPFIKERFKEGLTYDSIKFKPTTDLLKSKKFTYEEKFNISDIELRIIFFKIGAYHTIKDGRILFGYRLGDVQHYLDYYYMTYNLAPNWFEGHNLHNQYLQYFITYGIFGYLFFISYIFYSLYISFKKRNVLHLLFILMILFVFIFEVYLARNKGIVFFFFFNSIFLIYNKQDENRNFRHSRNTKSSRWL